MNKNFEEWEEADFKDWASKMYRAWLSGLKEPLEAVIEKRDKTEGQNE